MNNQTKNKTKIGITIACVAIVVILCSAFAWLAVPAMTDKAYEGVYVGDVYVGGLDKSEIETKLMDEYGKYEINPRFSYEGKEFQIYSSQINLASDFKQSAEKAVSYGKEGNIIAKISKVSELKKNPVTLELNVVADLNLLRYALSENVGEEYAGAEEYKVEFGENCLIVTNGKKGRGIDSKKIIAAISQNLTKKEPNKVIEVIIEDILPEDINPKTFCELYNRDAKDAECTSDGDSIKIIPEIIGVKIDVDEATKILNENKNNPDSYTIPAILTYPTVTASQLEEEFTDCVIATYQTNYSTSSPNRKENIRLAAEKINGKILNPAEEFSFNDVVGPRTAENGYKMAHVYVGNKTVDGLGGGICQVSSTLYNAVVFADLEIVYRTNHSMPVSYVPLGRDATVSYGTIDFIFKNNKTTPVKFEVIADGTNLTVNIYGRKKYIQDISIENEITGSVAFSVVEEKDDTMYEDERVVVEKGSYGTNVVTYKVVKENGEVVSRTLLAKSSYTPTTQVERVGTLKREDVPSEENSDIDTPTNSELPPPEETASDVILNTTTEVIEAPSVATEHQAPVINDTADTTSDVPISSNESVDYTSY